MEADSKTATPGRQKHLEVACEWPLKRNIVGKEKWCCPTKVNSGKYGHVKSLVGKGVENYIVPLC